MVFLAFQDQISCQECQACRDRKDPRVEKVQKGRSVKGDHQECRVPGETEARRASWEERTTKNFGNKRGTWTCGNEEESEALWEIKEEKEAKERKEKAPKQVKQV